MWAHIFVVTLHIGTAYSRARFFFHWKMNTKQRVCRDKTRVLITNTPIYVWTVERYSSDVAAYSNTCVASFTALYSSAHIATLPQPNLPHTNERFIECGWDVYIRHSTPKHSRIKPKNHYQWTRTKAHCCDICALWYSHTEFVEKIYRAWYSVCNWTSCCSNVSNIVQSWCARIEKHKLYLICRENR